ncbi:MAG: response regulator [Balneolaceae bacterium]|nr:MAG: response regulator [Balneolaceae bacterium]
MTIQTSYNLFLVDDDPFYLSLLHKKLTNSGYQQISTFTNGVDCLNALDQKPDIIFLDHNMDTFSGYEVLKKIKRQNPDIFVVMVSGQEDIKTAVDSLKHGAFDYILKSGNDSEKINAVIEKIAQVKELQSRNKPGILKSIFSLV